MESSLLAPQAHRGLVRGGGEPAGNHPGADDAAFEEDGQPGGVGVLRQDGRDERQARPAEDHVAVLERPGAHDANELGGIVAGSSVLISHDPPPARPWRRPGGS